MKLALLGSNLEAVRLVRAIADEERYELAAAYETRQDSQEIYQLAPLANQDDQWESLLLGTVADAVIIAGGREDDTRADQLRKLVQSAIPLLLIHPACPAIVGYELDMIRRDTGCVMVPFIPGSLHPAVRRMTQLARQDSSSALGAIEQLVFERTTDDRSRENVIAHFACDVHLVRMMLGEVHQISAMGATKEGTSFANLCVNMRGAADILARWSIVPVDVHPQAKLSILGTRGQLTLHMPRRDSEWTIDWPENHSRRETFEDWNEHRHIMRILDAAINGEESPTTWDDACRDLEVISAVQQSVRRRRMIEIYDEEHSEEQTFKGIMAMGGCGMLLAALLFLVGLAVFEGLTLPFREPSQSIAEDDQKLAPPAPLVLRLWPFYPFAAFLLLQLLQLVFPSNKKLEKHASSSMTQSEKNAS